MHITIEPDVGDDMKDVVRQSLRLARQLDIRVEFIANQIWSFARPDESLEAALERWHNPDKGQLILGRHGKES